MRKTDIRDDLLMALSLLTRLPFPQPDWNRAAPAARAAWAYPLAGLVVALLAGAVGWIAVQIGLPAQLTAGAILITMIMSTGAMHEDGLADCADGIWGGWDVARRLEIMRDSRIGAYGVIALVVSLLLRWAALTAVIELELLWPALIATAMMSRGAMVIVMHVLPHARSDGLSQKTGRPGRESALCAAGIGVLASLGLFDITAFWLLGVSALVLLSLARLAKVKIGGQTGDVLGATQQVCEIALLATILTLQ